MLVAARETSERLAVACTTCYNVLRRTNHSLVADDDRREKLNFFIEAEYNGDLQIFDVLQLLRDEIGFEKIARMVKKPLSGLKAAAYYGCMVLRPPAEVAYDDPENPSTLDDLLVALGAQTVDYPHKAECCGSYLAVVSAEAASEMTHTILSSAHNNGARLIVTNCPLCQFNLDVYQSKVRREYDLEPIPILYFSQILGLALGIPADELGIDRCVVSARSVLERRAAHAA